MAGMIVVSEVIEDVVGEFDLGEKFTEVISSMTEEANKALGQDTLISSSMDVSYIESRDDILIVMWFNTKEMVEPRPTQKTQEEDSPYDFSEMEEYEHQNLLRAHAEGIIADYKIDWLGSHMRAGVRTTDGKGLELIADGSGKWYVFRRVFE